jgi:hypothetical protein
VLRPVGARRLVLETANEKKEVGERSSVATRNLRKQGFSGTEAKRSLIHEEEAHIGSTVGDSRLFGVNGGL